MVPPDAATHRHDHGHGHAHAHPHAHAPATPHPAQTVSWSILRMPAATRLAAALGVSSVLWAIVWLAMR